MIWGSMYRTFRSKAVVVLTYLSTGLLCQMLLAWKER